MVGSTEDGFELLEVGFQGGGLPGLSSMLIVDSRHEDEWWRQEVGSQWVRGEEGTRAKNL